MISSRKINTLLVSLFLGLSATASAQIRSAAELPLAEELSRVAADLEESVRRMDSKIEKDSQGRLKRVISGGVASVVNYDLNGKIDSVLFEGRVTKVRLATDTVGNPIIRLFDGSGGELQPTDLKGVGIPQTLIDSIVGNAILPVDDTIYPKSFAISEMQEKSASAANQLSSGVIPKGRPVKSSSQFLENPDFAAYTPQCMITCDYLQSIEVNECDRDDNNRLGVCALGAVGLSELPPVAGGFAIACIAYSKNVLASCKAGAIARRFTCAQNCG